MPFIHHQGVRIAYEEAGTGPALLLLMGLGACGAAWEKHLAAYARHFRCLVVDNRGAGGSGAPAGPYTTAGMAADAAAVLDHLGIRGAAVAGISMGGAIAQELALQRPELVRRLVLVSAWARCDAYCDAVFAHFAAARPQLAPADFTALLQLWIWAPPYYAREPDSLRSARTAENPMTAAAFAAQCSACRAHDALDRLQRITQPVLLTAGDQDHFTPLRFSAQMHARLPDARLMVFADCGHCHHWEALEHFNRHTLAFLLAGQERV